MENKNTVETVQEGEQTEAVPPSGLRREVKTYVLRAGRMTAAQEKAYAELAPSWCIPFENKKLNFVDVFGNTKNERTRQFLQNYSN